jgi:molybdopterin molybdotransferase
MREGDMKDAVQVRVLARRSRYGGGARWRGLGAVPAEARAEEGWILGVGAEEALRRRLR